MDEYIKRDSVLHALCQVSAPTPSESYIVEKCVDKVNSVPAGDVVERSELVRAIFADFERFIDENKDAMYSPYGNYMGQCVYLGLFRDAFADFKKKYMQEDSLDAKIADAATRSETAVGNGLRKDNIEGR